jgi:predicted lipoprotein with Yx(FWY)xxD motif
MSSKSLRLPAVIAIAVLVALTAGFLPRATVSAQSPFFNGFGMYGMFGQTYGLYGQNYGLYGQPYASPFSLVYPPPTSYVQPYVQPNVAYASPTYATYQPAYTSTYSQPSVIIDSAKLTQPAPLPGSGSYGSGSSYTTSAYVTSGTYGIPMSMLTLASSSTLGPHLDDGHGMSLYSLSADATNRSYCSGTCTSIWPPATPSGTLSAQSGITGTFSTMTRDDGSLQATYNGMPLYFFSHDMVAGDTNGNGITDQFGTWSVARP